MQAAISRSRAAECCKTEASPGHRTIHGRFADAAGSRQESRRAHRWARHASSGRPLNLATGRTVHRKRTGELEVRFPIGERLHCADFRDCNGSKAQVRCAVTNGCLQYCNGMDAPTRNGIDVPKWKCHRPLEPRGASIMKITTIGIDLAKSVFVRPASRLSLCLTGGTTT